MPAPHRPADRRVPPAVFGRHRRTAGAVALSGVALLLAACSSSSSPSTTSTTRASTTTTTAATTTTTTTAASATTTTGAKATGCATSTLAVTIGSPNGTAGAVHYLLTYRNTGASTCTMSGYPGVSFLAAGGNQIGAPAQRTTGVGTAVVTLPPGARAYSSVSVTDPGIPPCSAQATATQVRVYPPGQYQSAVVTAPGGIAVCSSSNTASYQSAVIGPVVSTAP